MLKQIKLSFQIGLLALLLGLPQAGATIAPVPYPLAGLTPAQAGFTPEQTAQLQALGIKIIVPGYIPPGFRVYSVWTQKSNRETDAGPQYKIAYTARDSGEMFAVVGVSKGVRTSPAGQVETVRNLEFGPLKVFSQQPGSGPYLLSQWLGQGPFYQVESPALVNRKLQPQIISLAEFKKVCQFLTVLKPSG